MVTISLGSEKTARDRRDLNEMSWVQKKYSVRKPRWQKLSDLLIRQDRLELGKQLASTAKLP